MLTMLPEPWAVITRSSCFRLSSVPSALVGGIALGCLLNHWAGFALGAGVVDCGVEAPEALDRPVDETANIIHVLSG
jgi:hypothetical protein